MYFKQAVFEYYDDGGRWSFPDLFFVSSLCAKYM